MSDPTIERIEAELRESRTQAWDVETFLANRHQAKIEALETPPGNHWLRAGQTFLELLDIVALYVGRSAVIVGILFWISWRMSN